MERKIIAHRANLIGPVRETENTYETITEAIKLGFDVETDIWRIDGILYMGHDFDRKKPFKDILDFLFWNCHNLWIHCKNIEALTYLSQFVELNVFGHDNDNYVLTSRGNIFTKPGYPTNKNAVMVMPEMTPVYTLEDFDNCYGVCTDYPLEVKEKRIGRFCQVIL